VPFTPTGTAAAFAFANGSAATAALPWYAEPSDYFFVFRRRRRRVFRIVFVAAFFTFFALRLRLFAI